MGKDKFKNAGSKLVGWGGIKCQCCDNKLSHKRKSKVGRNLFSRMRRSILKQETQQEINEEIMGDGISNMWGQFEEYTELCVELGIDSLSINDDNWMDHWYQITRNNDKTR